jgi:hypothetical protein
MQCASFGVPDDAHSDGGLDIAAARVVLEEGEQRVGAEALATFEQRFRGEVRRDFGLSEVLSLRGFGSAFAGASSIPLQHNWCKPRV